MNVPSIYTNIVSGLLQKSQSNEVIWNTTTDTDTNTFIVYFNKFSLSIRQISKSDFNNNDYETWITVDLIKNDNGDKIDSFVIEEGDNDWDKIVELYTLARRSALSIDNAIQEMFTEINKKGIIGKKKSKDNDDDGFTDDIPF